MAPKRGLISLVSCPGLWVLPSAPLGAPPADPCAPNSAPSAMCEMIKIMQEYGEVTCCLGSSANLRNSCLFLQSDVRSAQQPRARTPHDRPGPGGEIRERGGGGCWFGPLGDGWGLGGPQLMGTLPPSHADQHRPGPLVPVPLLLGDLRLRHQHQHGPGLGWPFPPAALGAAQQPALLADLPPGGDHQHHPAYRAGGAQAGPGAEVRACWGPGVACRTLLGSRGCFTSTSSSPRRFSLPRPLASGNINHIWLKHISCRA